MHISNLDRLTGNISGGYLITHTAGGGHRPEGQKRGFVGDDSVSPGSVILVSNHVVLHHVLHGLIHSVSTLILLRECKVVLEHRRGGGGEGGRGGEGDREKEGEGEEKVERECALLPTWWTLRAILAAGIMMS